MSKPPSGLSAGEAALWARLAQTVRPFEDRAQILQPDPSVLSVSKDRPSLRASRAAPRRKEQCLDKLSMSGAVSDGADLRSRPHTLDASWDRKLAKAVIAPDFTLDLHGHTLASAHARLDHGLTLACAQGARLVLLITGRPRPADDAAGRGERRGAIRAKYLDWLASGPHAHRIAAVRPAHPRHGGAGAVYIVLRRGR